MPLFSLIYLSPIDFILIYFYFILPLENSNAIPTLNSLSSQTNTQPLAYPNQVDPWRSGNFRMKTYLIHVWNKKYHSIISYFDRNIQSHMRLPMFT